ncbi:hypothetical protein IMSAGC018_02329 [Lachnospiraceae bacterium]|nr:hypothetical protein IMSAGC018_02329 [Lachnospiraceae bacterium]
MVLGIDKVFVRVSMAKKEINQKQLAIASGISESTLSNILTGKSDGNPKTWGKIAKALGVDVTEIIKQ